MDGRLSNAEKSMEGSLQGKRGRCWRGGWLKIASMQFLTMSFPMENSPVLIANILTRPPWRYLFTDTE